MTLYFSYGSNMNRELMRRHCPGAKERGTAALFGCRFIITTDGYASIVPRSGGRVYGVLWRLSVRDIAALNAYEGIASGLYSRLTLPVRKDGHRIPAMLYVSRTRTVGRPKSGYLKVVVDAARAWSLPAPYVRSLQRWAPTQWCGTRAADCGELG